MYNHNKAQQSKNRVHISWDILYAVHYVRVNSLGVDHPVAVGYILAIATA